MTLWIVLLIGGLVVTGAGALSWKSGGKHAVLSGVAISAAATYWLLGDSHAVIRYCVLAVFAVVLLVSLSTAPRGSSRRPELILLAAAGLVLLIGMFFQDALSSEARIAIGVVFSLIVICFFAVTILGLLRDARSNTLRRDG